ncbi:MAG: hypothetical protein WDW36_007633 [Sanguina aurantia]
MMNSAADDDSSYRDERYSNDVHQLILEGRFRLSGVMVPLPVHGKDSVRKKVEALKSCLGQQLGTDTFHRVHALLKSLTPTNYNEAEVRTKCDALLGSTRLPYLELVLQLMVCEDNIAPAGSVDRSWLLQHLPIRLTGTPDKAPPEGRHKQSPEGHPKSQGVGTPLVGKKPVQQQQLRAPSHQAQRQKHLVPYRAAAAAATAAAAAAAEPVAASAKTVLPFRAAPASAPPEQQQQQRQHQRQQPPPSRHALRTRWATEGARLEPPQVGGDAAELTFAVMMQGTRASLDRGGEGDVDAQSEGSTTAGCPGDSLQEMLEGRFRVNGAQVPLPVRDSDSLQTKLEALKVYLGQQLGTETFTCVYRRLDTLTADDDEAEVSRHFIALLGPTRLPYLQLVHQLIACEEHISSALGVRAQ